MHARLFVVLAAGLGLASGGNAQTRVGSDSATRLDRLERDLTYGTAEGFAYALNDQRLLTPPQWGAGWRGYERRAASNIGEFWVQEITTEGLAAAMNRPLDYQRCRCRDFGDRMVHALHGALFDPLPKGKWALAVPRIVGAYGGAYAQTTWRPSPTKNRASITLTNGTTSLAIGALINMYHEIRR